MMKRTKQRLSGATVMLSLAGALAAAGGMMTGAALGQTTVPNNTRPTWSNMPQPTAARGAAAKPITFHWAGITPLNGNYANNWRIPLDFGPVPMRQDVKVIYGQFLGTWPLEGVHVLLSDPTRMNRHLASIPAQTSITVDVPNWDGLIVIDMENWQPIWSRYPEHLKVKFRDAVAQHRPSVVAGKSGQPREAAIKALFDTTIRDLYTRTLTEIKRTYPRSKVSFLGVPLMLFGMDEFVPRGQPGYGDVPNASMASRLNDEVSWLVDAQDFVCAYVGAWAVALNPPEVADYSKCTVPADWNWRYYRSNLTEVVRFARGKPVYGFMGSRYGQNWGQTSGKPMLRDLCLYQLMTAYMMEPNISGMIFWDEHHTSSVVRQWEQYLGGRFWTAAQAVSRDFNRSLPSANAPIAIQGWESVGGQARAGRVAPPSYSAALSEARFANAAPNPAARAAAPAPAPTQPAAPPVAANPPAPPPVPAPAPAPVASVPVAASTPAPAPAPAPRRPEASTTTSTLATLIARIVNARPSTPANARPQQVTAVPTNP